MEYKTCTKCEIELPATNEYFNNDIKGKNGLSSQCKNCHNKHYNQNKEHYKELRKQYYNENKEKISKQMKQYREENKERLLKKAKQCNEKYKGKYKGKYKEQKKQYREENKEKIKVSNKKYKEKNRDNLLELKNQYRKENREQIAEKQSIYRKENRSKCNVYSQKRRSSKKQLPHTLTVEQWILIQAKFNNKCAYCGEEKPLTQDHFIPLSKGGEYTHNNIIPACRSCNASKHDSDFFEWYSKQEYYSKEREIFILKHLGYSKEMQQLKII